MGPGGFSVFVFLWSTQMRFLALSLSPFLSPLCVCVIYELLTHLHRCSDDDDATKAKESPVFATQNVSLANFFLLAPCHVTRKPAYTHNEDENKAHKSEQRAVGLLLAPDFSYCCCLHLLRVVVCVQKCALLCMHALELGRVCKFGGGEDCW